MNISEIALYTLYLTAGCFVIAIVGLYLNIWDRIKPFLLRLLNKPLSLGINQADKLKIVHIPQSSRWYVGTHNNKPAIWLYVKFYVTNIGIKPNQVVSSYLKKYKTSSFILERPSNKYIWGEVKSIPPSETFEYEIQYFLYRKHPKEESNLVLDFLFQDIFANIYVLKNVILDFTHKSDR